MMLRCRFLGHKWIFTGHSGMSDKEGSGYEVYQCSRCGQYCHISEMDDSKEIYA